MSKIHGLMDTGKRSMMNSQTALQTVGHNIANKSTEGYSRQRVEIQSNEPVGAGKLRIGTGSKTAMVSRVNNPYLEKQIGQEQSKQGFFDGKGDAMTRVEQVYNEQVNKGLNTFVTDFFNSFREFSNNPESLATRTQVKETAEFLTKDFKRVSNQLTEIQKDIDQQIATSVHDINEISREIASLNEKVQMVQMQGGPGNDERDRRDLLIKQLGEKVNIRWAEGNDGMVTVSAGNSALLVAGYDAKTLVAKATGGTDTKGEGNFDVFYKNSKDAIPMVVTGQLTGGRIGGLLEVRDKVINGLHANLDEMAYSLASSVNDIHSRGYDAYNQKAGKFFDFPPVTFEHPADVLKLSDAVSTDVGRIASGATPNSPGDNRIASMLGQMQFQSVMDDGRSTLDEFYNSMVGQVGIQSKRTQSAQASQADIVKQLGNIRESISGVSLDEETTKLVEFQKAFDASARLVKTADEMFDTVLNLKRM
jgi:flagellar hook-associated protein 1 FlgK